nr:flavin-dependent monooxygenase [Euura sp. 'Pontania]
MPSTKTRVAIVGAGVAGLVVAKRFTAELDTFSFTLFEQSSQVGGTWVYTDDTEYDNHGLPVHSSMYKNLRTNLPKEVMEIPDFPFKDQDGPSFVHHSVIRDYLWSYAKHFNLYPHMKLSTLVKHIEPETLPSGQTVWLITSEDLESKIVTTKTFDVVILCNGHYTVGHVPHIRGIDSFCGKAIHSHQYRDAETYAKKKVCILGASWSGIDIALEIAKHADKVYLSHKPGSCAVADLPECLEAKPGIASIHGNTFIFDNGDSAEVDEFIYCTGYDFTYPFLSEKVELSVKDDHVEPIYKHLVHTDAKNLFFMGLPGIVIPFRMFHIQAQYIVHILTGRITLPSSKEMREDFEEEKRKCLNDGIALRHLLKLKDRQWPYYDEIAAKANIATVPPVIRKIVEFVNKTRDQDLRTYKDYRYRVLDSENFTVHFGKEA